MRSPVSRRSGSRARGGTKRPRPGARVCQAILQAVVPTPVPAQDATDAGLEPIAWLQQYSWKARLSKWGLCLAFLLVEVAARNADEERLNNPSGVAADAGRDYTFGGVSSFLEEKRSGALELLLVTPIPVNKLIFGRVWGLWKQFLPAGVVLACGYLAWR